MNHLHVNICVFPTEQSFREEGQPGETEEKIREQQDESGGNCGGCGDRCHHYWSYNLRHLHSSSRAVAPVLVG